MGCRVFTHELCRVAWPVKFKPDLPPHYDGSLDPTEFQKIYAPTGDDKFMANWL